VAQNLTVRKWWKWIVAGLAVVLVVAVGAPFVYIHFIEGPAPAKLALPGATSTSGAGAGAVTTAGSESVTGTYHVGTGSEAGYRVSEVLVGQSATAVGRTSKIWGTVTISGTAVTAATITVNMATVVSDQSERNDQFDNRIMDVWQYPTATLTLTSPIALGTVPAVGATATYQATGTLDMHGATKPVTFTLKAERSANGMYALADIPLQFATWDIANPSVGGFVTTANSGTLEALVFLTKLTGNPVSSGSGSESGGGGPGGPVTVPKTTVPPITIPAG
jgi:polyisoprenoid-binding protein YceI